MTTFELKKQTLDYFGKNIIVSLKNGSIIKGRLVGRTFEENLYEVDFSKPVSSLTVETKIGSKRISSLDIESVGLFFSMQL